MTNPSALVYDCEIVNAIQGRKEEKLPGINYCKGWRDFEGMGISVVCAYDYLEDRYRLFEKDNADEFASLIESRELLIGFNSITFDNQLIYRNWRKDIDPARCYDILREAWAGAGLGPVFAPSTHGGYSLDAMAEANLGQKKSGHGALAPVQWQRGERGAVIDYCLQDIALTKKLFDKVLATGSLVNPKRAGELIYMKAPSILEASS